MPEGRTIKALQILKMSFAVSLVHELLLSFELKMSAQQRIITGIWKLLSLTGITNTMWRLQPIPMWHSRCPAPFCRCIHGHRWHHRLPLLPLHHGPLHHDGSSSSGWGSRELQVTRGRVQWRWSWRGPGESVEREDGKWVWRKDNQALKTLLLLHINFYWVLAGLAQHMTITFRWCHWSKKTMSNGFEIKNLIIVKLVNFFKLRFIRNLKAECISFPLMC